MADSWYEYIQGSPEQRLADLEKQRVAMEAIKANPNWQRASPRQRMMAAGDNLYPTRNTEALDDLGNAASYVLDAGVRPRDTAIRAVQEAAAGNPVRAAGLAASAIPSAAVPSLGAGGPGSEDDWRKHGNPLVSFALDMATDPMNYAGVGLLGRGAKAVASKVDDAADAVRSLRYSADLTDLPPWVRDDIAAALPRPSPESSMEAMLQARRMVNRETPGPTATLGIGYDGNTMRAPMAPHEWDAAEVERFGDGYEYTTRLNTRGQRKGVRVPSEPIRPYPNDPAETRAIQRRLTAEALLDKGRQNPDILSQLPAVFRLPVSDDLILRLASQSPDAAIPSALRYARQNPMQVGAAIGALGTLGGGLAYGLYPDEDVVRGAE